MLLLLISIVSQTKNKKKKSLIIRSELKNLIVVSAKIKRVQKKMDKNLLKTPEKNNNNNIYTHNNTHNNTHNQLDLNFNPISLKPKLSISQKMIFETFYANQSIAITQKQLYLAWGDKLHPNTIQNFINKAKQMGWIKKLNLIKGSRISGPLFDYESPNTISTGQEVFDKRFTYYQITSKGIAFFEEN